MTNLPELRPGSTINATNIRRARRARGLTQAELGKLVGVSERAVRAWESGKSRPDQHHRPTIAEILGLDPAAPNGNRGELRALRARLEALELEAGKLRAKLEALER